MKSVIFCFLAFLAVGFCLLVDDVKEECEGASLNGILEIGCWGYRECVKNNTVILRHECLPGEVLERDTMTCTHPDDSTSECGKGAICLGRDDGLYGDATNCQTFFRCEKEANIGRYYCPANLVFNKDIGTCDWTYSVVPPCGTKDV